MDSTALTVDASTRNKRGRVNRTVAKVLIIGASRGIGRATVTTALSAGHSVRALARSPTRSDGDGSSLETVAADALDREAVGHALQGIDVVIQALGIRASPRTVLCPVSLFSDATRILVDAMQETGVRRLISVTGFGAGNSRAVGNLLYCAGFELVLRQAYNDKDYQERIIRNSGLDWVIARPGILTNRPARHAYRVLTNAADWRPGFISRADVANFLVKQIGQDDYLGQTPVLIN